MRKTLSLYGRHTIFQENGGWGFIKQDDPAPDLFVHVNNILGNGWKMLLPGDLVEFEVARTARGSLAVRVIRLEGRNDSRD